MVLRDVRPDGAVDDAPDLTSGYVKPMRQCQERRSLFAARSNSAHVVVSEFCAGVTHAIQMRSRYAALVRSIANIVCLRAQKQMDLINARADVAAMQDVQPIWNRAVCPLPREAVCIHDMVAAPWSVEHAVAVTCSAAPQPTTVCLLNLRPKALGERIHSGILHG